MIILSLLALFTTSSLFISYSEHRASNSLLEMGIALVYHNYRMNLYSKKEGFKVGLN